MGVRPSSRRGQWYSPEDGLAIVTIGQQQSKLPPAPKIFWTYWQELPVPPIVEACIRSWETHHPGYVVNVITRENVDQFIGTKPHTEYPWVDSAARESDLVRLFLLAKYGGVWLDATVLLAERLVFFDGVAHPGPGPEFSAFYLEMFTTNGQCPVIESWALACRPQAPFVSAWLREFLSIPMVPDGVALKLKDYLDAGVDIQNIDNGHYLLIHVAAQFILQFHRHLVSMELYSAEETPYKYLMDADWESDRAVCAMVAGFPHRGGVFKLRSLERAMLTPEDVGTIMGHKKSPAGHA